MHRTNWNRVILEGRKPGLTLGIGCESAQFPLAQVGKDLFRDLRRVAQTWTVSTVARHISRSATSCWPADDPELTFSARILRSMIEEGIGGTGRALADRYRTQLREEPLEILSEDDFIAERDASVARQKKVEAEDSEPFEALLARHA